MTPSAAGQGAGSPVKVKPTKSAEATSAAVTYNSCRIKIDGTPTVMSRIPPPIHAVMTPAATAETGETPNCMALLAPYTEYDASPAASNHSSARSGHHRKGTSHATIATTTHRMTAAGSS